MPVLARLQSEYRDDGLQVLAINIQPSYYSLDEWASYVKNYAPIGLEEVAWAMAAQDVSYAAIRQYELKWLGTQVLVDRNGKVVFRSETGASESRLRSEIERVLQR